MGLFPTKDADLLAFSLNLSTKITATPTAYNLTSGIASAYAAVHAAFAAALAACDPTERNQTATAAKNAARANLKVQAKYVINQVEASATVTTAQKLELGVRPRAVPTPQPVPLHAPAMLAQSIDAWTVQIQLRDATDTARRGRPVATAGAAVFSHVGASAPTDLNQWKFEGNVGRVNKINVSFDSSLPAGTKVWFTSFWFNGSKASGPLSAPISRTLIADSVAM